MWLGCCGLGKNECEKEMQGSSFSISWVLGSVHMKLRFLVPKSKFTCCAKSSCKMSIDHEVLTSLCMIIKKL